MPDKPKRPVGRPAKPMPDLIPDTPENIARTIMQGLPAKEWVYLVDSEDKTPGDSND